MLSKTFISLLLLAISFTHASPPPKHCPPKPSPTTQLLTFESPTYTEYAAYPLPTPYNGYIFKPASDAPDTFVEIYRPCSLCSGANGIKSPSQLLSAVLGSLVIEPVPSTPKEKCTFDLLGFWFHPLLPQDPDLTYEAEINFSALGHGTGSIKKKTLRTREWREPVRIGKEELGGGWKGLEKLTIRVNFRDGNGTDLGRGAFTVDDLGLVRRCTRLK